MKRPEIKDFMITDSKITDILGEVPDLMKYSKANKKYIDQLEKQLKLTSVSSRLPFKDELDKLCKDYIETTRKEDEGKWFDNRMIDKVEFWCKWIREFAKANDY